MQSLDKPDYFFNLSVWSAPPVTYENKGAAKTGNLTFDVPSSVSYIYADCRANALVNGSLTLNLADSKTFGQIVTIHVVECDANNPVILNLTGYSSSLDKFTFNSSNYDPYILSFMWLGDHWSIMNKSIIIPAIN